GVGVDAQIVEHLEGGDVTEVRRDVERVVLAPNGDPELVAGIDRAVLDGQVEVIAPDTCVFRGEGDPALVGAIGHRHRGRGGVTAGDPHDVALRTTVVEELQHAVGKFAVGDEIAV